MTKTDATQRTIMMIALVLTALAVSLLGGSSRADAIQNSALRPILALLLIPALVLLDWSKVRSAKGLVGLAVLFGLWIALQLVPLPPALWQALPNRTLIAQLDDMAGLQGLWRPISLAPHGGWNALAGYVVPVAALLIALTSKARAPWLMLVIVFIGLANAAFGLVQVTVGQSGSLHLYQHATPGMPTGLFANENHASAFSAICILIIARLRLTADHERLSPALKHAAIPALVVLLLAVLVSGSRGGIITAVISVLIAATMAWVAARHTVQSVQRGNNRRASATLVQRHPKFVIVGVLLGIGLLFGMFFLFQRSGGMMDLTATDAAADMRWQLTPVLLQMAMEHGLFGTGFGSFSEVYQIYEPTDLLLPQYVNQAHNDWLQLLIEGGVPAVAMLGSLGVWAVRRLLQLHRGGGAAPGASVFWLGIFAIIGISSLFDYPLRTPIFQMVYMWLMLCLSLESSRGAAPSQRASAD